MEIETSATVLPPELVNTLDRRIADGTLDLPLLPEAAAMVLSMSKDDDFDQIELEATVKRDPAMAAHLLRLANSAMFAARIPIVSLRQAIGRLGAYQLRQIALMFSCQTRVFKIPGWETEIRKKFVHSLTCAVYAEEVARLAQMNPEESFSAGLLHDVGYPVLLQAIVDMQRKFHVSLDRHVIRECASARHAAAGGQLARAWLLPPRLVSVITQHHEPKTAGEMKRSSCLVHLADELARELLGEAPEEGQPPFDPSVLGVLGIPEAAVQGLREKTHEVESLVRDLS